MTINLTVGILYKNESNDLINLLQSLLNIKTKLKFDIIILCNGCMLSEKVIDLLNYKFNKGRIINEPYNIGFAAGRNKLIRECTTKYILMCDVDVIITRNYMLDLLYYTLKIYKFVYTVVPKIYFYETNRLWYDGGYNKLKYKDINRDKLDEFKSDNIEDFSFSNIKLGDIIGTCHLINRDKFIKNNIWFDEEFFIYFEDLNFSYNKKIYCVYQPNTYVYHNVEYEIKHFDKFRAYLTLRNGIIMNLTHFNFIGLFIILKKNLFQKLQPIKLRLRAVKYGIKLSLVRLLVKYGNKIYDVNEFKFVNKLSNECVILR